MIRGDAATPRPVPLWRRPRSIGPPPVYDDSAVAPSPPSRTGEPHVQEQLRRTKIIATLGPATDAPGALKRLIGEGVDVVRLNLSHGTPDDHRQRAAAVRAAAMELG